ncbi:glutamyl-tRNA synthetase [Saccharata proteae CBS 121410]|uniref:Glutamate--tRNA ligase, mitochondrial n=1 Tax=Saccharata proteae CBS 121410 TaxID=1314787 RepID=A0A9P4HWG0_9PEZI|nr:glutamyl-tRNA synthetase [Saccharata proteae CBS 121410]
MTGSLSLASRHTTFICSPCRDRLGRFIWGKSKRQGTRSKHKSGEALKAEWDSSKPLRTRFAPSPTGYLHLGSLRTALYNYLLAKKSGGQFLLRIEDTDQKRTIPDAEQRIIEDLQWAGLEWDEGLGVGGPCGPYRQSERTELYQEHAKKLLESGHAYRCFCVPQKLRPENLLRLPACRNRYCASLSKEEADDRAQRGHRHVIRLLAPDIYPEFVDHVYGILNKPDKKQTKQQQSHDDPVLLKGDGQPTYHLANVVDDHFMRIDHVIRGTEWIPSTPKHIALYNAFGWKPPNFSHVGLLVDKGGSKLSKRRMDVDITSYRDAGYYPQTITNFVALLGWSHTRDSDVMDLDDLVQAFRPKFTKGNATMSHVKLSFLQQAHLVNRFAEYNAQGKYNPGYVDEREKVISALVSSIESNPGPYEGYKSINPDLTQYCRNIFNKCFKKYTSVPSFLEDHDYFFKTPIVKQWPDPDITSNGTRSKKQEILTRLHHELRAVEKELNNVKKYRRGSADLKKLSKRLFGWMREALAGGKSGIGVADTMEILGRDASVERLERYMENQRLGRFEERLERYISGEVGKIGDESGGEKEKVAQSKEG